MECDGESTSDTGEKSLYLQSSFWGQRLKKQDVFLSGNLHRLHRIIQAQGTQGVRCVLEPWPGEGTGDDAEGTLGATDVETVACIAGDGTAEEGGGFRILSGCT